MVSAFDWQAMIDKDKFDAHAWEATPLGTPSGWPRQLRYIADFLLTSKQPMFVLWGPERAFIFNAAYQAIWGRESVRQLGQPIRTVAAENWNALKRLVDDVFSGNSFVETDFAIEDGEADTVRYFDFSYTPVRDQEGPGIVGALCICTDVTERFRSAERTRAEREVLALTVENVTEGVALVEADLTLVLWNEPFRVHFGYAPDEIRTGMNAVELMLKTAERGDLGPGDPMLVVEDLVHSIRSTESATLEIQRSDGTVLSLFRRTVGGSRYLLVSNDVTDERRTARLKDELVSTVSHELRTPLTAISGALGMVAAGAAGALPAKADRLIQIAHRNSERLTVLVNDLLDIDKLQSGAAELHKRDVDLANIVRIAVEQNAPFADRANVALRAEVPDEPVRGKVDGDRIVQVITNLISNAVKFSPTGETVVVRLGKNHHHARISVIDNGPGIAENFRNRLFDRFSQQDGTISRVQQGSGLGLAISKGIVEGHGGTIELDPSTVRGATFHIDLPLDLACEN